MKINLFYDTIEGITKFTTLDDEHIFFSGKLVIVPAGFESDGASIPRFWWARVQPISNHIQFRRQKYVHCSHQRETVSVP